MTSISGKAALETEADQRRDVRRLLKLHAMALIGTVIRIAVAAGAIVLGVRHAQETSNWASNLVVVGLIVFVCLRGATESHSRMIDLWRDLRRPLPPIDGAETVLVRTRFSRSEIVLSAILASGWTAFWLWIFVVAWPNPGALLFAGTFALKGLLVLKAVLFPRPNGFDPLVIDGEGFEDRSGPHGWVAWDDVADLRWRPGGVAVKLAKPDSARRRDDAIEVHTTGFPAAGHRAFRLLRAYWRFSRSSR